MSNKPETATFIDETIPPELAEAVEQLGAKLGFRVDYCGFYSSHPDIHILALAGVRDGVRWGSRMAWSDDEPEVGDRQIRCDMLKLRLYEAIRPLLSAA